MQCHDQVLVCIGGTVVFVVGSVGVLVCIQQYKYTCEPDALTLWIVEKSGGV